MFLGPNAPIPHPFIYSTALQFSFTKKLLAQKVATGEIPMLNHYITWFNSFCKLSEWWFSVFKCITWSNILRFFRASLEKLLYIILSLYSESKGSGLKIEFISNLKMKFPWVSQLIYIFFHRCQYVCPICPWCPQKTNNHAPVLSSWQTETARGGRRETGRDLAKGRGLWDFGCGTSCVKVRWLHSVVGRRGGGGEGLGLGCCLVGSVIIHSKNARADLGRAKSDRKSRTQPSTCH